MSKEKLLTIGTLAALCVLAAFSMHARAAGQESMVVVRDPLTGQLRAPTADELKELRARTPATTGFAAPARRPRSAAATVRAACASAKKTWSMKSSRAVPTAS